MTRFVAYYRVSTDRQGQSGLGLEAQRTAVTQHIGAAELVAEFTEVESGRKNDREQLALALAVGRHAVVGDKAGHLRPPACSRT